MLIALAVVLLHAAPARPSLQAGLEALEAFDGESAVKALERSRLVEGPFELDAHLKLHESLGIAYAYAGRAGDALASFEFVLALSPGHAISYTLSPKVTFLFERARQKHAPAPQLAFDVAWPRDIEGGAPLPITVEKVRDARGLATSFTLFARPRGDGEWAPQHHSAPVPGGYATVTAPALAELDNGTVVRELYLAAFDELGNEVFRWGSPASPREVASAPPPRWYQRGWVWPLLIGGVLTVAAGAGGMVYAVTRPLPGEISGSLSVNAR